MALIPQLGCPYPSEELYCSSDSAMFLANTFLLAENKVVALERLLRPIAGQANVQSWDPALVDSATSSLPCVPKHSRLSVREIGSALGLYRQSNHLPTQKDSVGRRLTNRPGIEQSHRGSLMDHWRYTHSPSSSSDTSGCCPSLWRSNESTG